MSKFIYLLIFRPIHGLIFLFKWVSGDEPVESVVQDDRLERIFFAKQVINNACATQAIISILLKTLIIKGVCIFEGKQSFKIERRLHNVE